MMPAASAGKSKLERWCFLWVQITILVLPPPCNSVKGTVECEEGTIQFSTSFVRGDNSETVVESRKKSRDFLAPQIKSENYILLSAAISLFFVDFTFID